MAFYSYDIMTLNTENDLPLNFAFNSLFHVFIGYSENNFGTQSNLGLQPVNTNLPEGSK